MIGDGVKALVGAAIVFVFLYGVAFAHPHVDCDMIRSQVKEHGKIKAYAWALANGYSPKEITRIRKACGV